MENAMLIGVSRQSALRRELDVVANNLANVNTAGYKGEHLVFEEFLMAQAREGDAPGQSSGLSYVLDTRLFRQFSEGSTVTTGNQLDVAVNGKGWFVVQTDDGERYTRNGHFKLNAQGELVTASGNRVLGEAGPITFGAEDTKIVIAQDGTISAESGQKGKLRIVQFDNENTLKKAGDSTFSAPNPPVAAQNVRLTQGAVEQSNVQPVVEMTRMIDVTQTYVATTRMVQNLGDLQRRAIEQLGGQNA